jgi:hypothetical protein
LAIACVAMVDRDRHVPAVVAVHEFLQHLVPGAVRHLLHSDDFRDG